MAWGLEHMGAEEFFRWQTYYQHEPWGNEWRQTAVIAAVTANSAMGRRAPVKVDDFMPCKPPKRQQTAEEMQAFFEALMGGGKGCQRSTATAKRSVAEMPKSA